MREATKLMVKEAVSTCFYEPRDFPCPYPRIQILTVAELLEGKETHFLEHHVETSANAERKIRHKQGGMF